METFLSLQISYANRILTTGLGPLLENVPFRSAMLLLQVHESAFGTSRTSGDVRLESAKRSTADIAQSLSTNHDLWVHGPVSVRMLRRTLPAGFLALAKSDKLPSGKLWLHEN